ncbi:immunoglobulin I-set domain protein, partial [Cooperia oncophora]
MTVLPEESDSSVRPTEIHITNIPFQEDIEHIVHDSSYRDFHAVTFTLGMDSTVPAEQSSPSPDLSEYSTSSSVAGQAPSFIVTMPRQVYSKVNENIQLKCTFTGQPLPAVTWQKDGNLVDMSRNYTIISEDGITILRLECTTLEDNAIFSCTIANSFGTETASCKVIIEDDELEHQRIGTQVICDREDASGEVNAVVMSPHKTTTTFTFSSPEVVEKTEEHREAAEQRSVETMDGQQPFFLLPLEDATLKGNTCTLKCIIMATPTAHVDWLVEDELVAKDEDHSLIYEDGIAILKIRNIQRDELRVSCTASNCHGRAETLCHLKRDYTDASVRDERQSPRFIIPLKNICTCTEEVKLKCVVEGEPVPEITWFVDGKEQVERTTYYDGVAELDIPILSVSHEIKCCARNSAGMAECHCVVTKIPVEGAASTLLSQKPYFVHPLHDQSTGKESLTLRVVVAASPPATLQWSIDGKTVTGDGDVSVIYEDGIGILSMSSLKTGVTEVSCVARNEYGICTTSAKVTRVGGSDLREDVEQQEAKRKEVEQWKDEDECDKNAETFTTTEIALSKREERACLEVDLISTIFKLYMSTMVISRKRGELESHEFEMIEEKPQLEKHTKGEEVKLSKEMDVTVDEEPWNMVEVREHVELDHSLEHVLEFESKESNLIDVGLQRKSEHESEKLNEMTFEELTPAEEVKPEEIKPQEEIKPVEEKVPQEVTETKELVEVAVEREITIEEIAEATATIEAIFTKTEEISGLEIDLITSPYDAVAQTATAPAKKKTPEEQKPAEELKPAEEEKPEEIKPQEEIKPVEEKVPQEVTETKELVEVAVEREITIEEIAEATATIEAIFTKTEEISGLEIDLITSPYDAVAQTATAPAKKKTPEEQKPAEELKPAEEVKPEEIKPQEEIKPVEEKVPYEVTETKELVEVAVEREITIEEIAEATATIEAIFTKTEEISGLEIDLITSPYDAVAQTATAPAKKKTPEEEKPAEELKPAEEEKPEEIKPQEEIKPVEEKVPYEVTETKELVEVAVEREITIEEIAEATATKEAIFTKTEEISGLEIDLITSPYDAVAQTAAAPAKKKTPEEEKPAEELKPAEEVKPEEIKPQEEIKPVEEKVPYEVTETKELVEVAVEREITIEEIA